MAVTPPPSEGSIEPSDVQRSENVKHLELIQSVVTRLATNSFLIKGWTLTVSAAAFGFAVNRIDWKLATAGALVVLGFWVLDGYYLRQERLFRHMYNHVRRNIAVDSNERFSMNLSPYVGFDTVRRMRVFFSVTLVVFYPLLILVGVAIAVVAAVIGLEAPIVMQ
ncbi:hypothetical protein WEH80_06035 [Actinomycetes bacterium KLBMP 9759]